MVVEAPELRKEHNRCGKDSSWDPQELRKEPGRTEREEIKARRLEDIVALKEE